MEAIKERGRQKILIEKDLFGTVRDKVKIAQERLKAFEPSEGYYVADSGGKDSACVLVPVSYTHLTLPTTPYV